MGWTQINQQMPPEGKVLMTKIDDANGSRNEQALKKSGNMWFVPDGSTHVYYSPTHWRELTSEELEKERQIIERKLTVYKKQVQSFGFSIR